MANVAIPHGEIVVDSRGRTSLARVRTQDYDRYFAQEADDGTITLIPVISFTPAGLDEFLDNPHERGTRRRRSSSGRLP